MPAVEEIIETELERVERWRADELMRAGFDPAPPWSSRRASTSTCTGRPSSSIAAARPSSPCRSCSSQTRPRGTAEWRHGRRARLDPFAADRRLSTSARSRSTCTGSCCCSRSRRRSGSPASAGSRSAATGISSTASRSGASSRGSSARGSTTTSRAGTRIRRSTTTGTGRSRSGRAASASGAGSALGVLVGAWVVKRSGNSVRLFMDAVAPGLLLAQAIGRWGNWWNQELYGKHTTCRGRSRSTARRAANLYHPTFLYEFIWDVARRVPAALDRPALHDPAAGALRSLRQLLHVRPHVRGAAAHRSVEPRLRAAAELLGLARLLPRRARRSSSSGSSSGTRRADGSPVPPGKAAPTPKPGPKMAVPRGRVR